MKTLMALLILLTGSYVNAQNIFEDNVNDITFTYPAAWKNYANISGNEYVTNDTGYFLLQVDSYFTDYDFNAEDIRDTAFRGGLYRQMLISTKRDVKLLDYGNMTVGGLPGYFILWEVPGKDNTFTNSSKIYSVQTGDEKKLYTFNAGSPTLFFDKYKEIFNSIISSIKIKSLK
jgi:hypothetical protein